MKRISNRIVMIFTIIGILLTSCEDFSDLLEKEETGEMDLQMVFSDIRNAEAVLSNLYNSLPAYLTGDQNGSGKLKQTGLVETFSVYGSTSVIATVGGLQFPFNRGDWSASYNYYTEDRGRPTNMGDFYLYDYAEIGRASCRVRVLI